MNSFISLVMRKPKPTRGLNPETNKSWNSCFAAIKEEENNLIWIFHFKKKNWKKRNKRDEWVWKMKTYRIGNWKNSGLVVIVCNARKPLEKKLDPIGIRW